MKIYRRFLASYLCVCLVPLLLSLVTIFQLEHRIQDSMEENQQSFIQTVRQEIDRSMGQAASTVSIFSNSSETARLAEKSQFSRSELFELCELSGSLSTIIDQNASYYRGFCYFARSGFLITDRRTYHPESVELFSWDLKVDPERFLAVLNDGSTAEHVTTLYKEKGGGWVLVLRSQYDQRRKELLSCVGIVIQLDKSLAPWNTEDFEAFATDEAYQLISGGKLAPQALEAMSKLEESEGELTLSGQRYVYSQYQSGLSGIRYGFLTRRDIYYQELRIVWFQLILEGLLIFGVSILLAVFWSRRTYRPIKGILPYVKPSQPECRSIAELGSALMNFAQEKEELESLAEQSALQAQKARLGQYLWGLSEDASCLSQYLEEGQPYQLLAFMPANPVHASEENFRALRECLDDILLAESEGVSLQLQNCAAVLVQKTLTSGEAAQVHFAAEQSLSMPLVCYMSDSYTHLESAPLAWASVYRALRHDSFWRKTRTRGVWPADSLPENDSQQSYRDFLSQQKALTECLAGGKARRAEACLHKLLKEDLSDQSLPVETLRRRYADIAEILLPYASGKGAEELQRKFLRGSTAQELEEGLLALFGMISWEEKSELKLELTEQVRTYIQANFQDPALNASMIADYLHMNLSTLSHQYKAATGIGLLDELHAVRLESAKNLLKEGVSVRETAERTGYVDPRALIRAFKRYEGITPGQFAKTAASGG